MAHKRQNHPARRATAFFAALVMVSLLSFAPAAADPTAPSDDDVRTAQENESAVALDAAAAEVELVNLSTTLDSAWEDAKAAGEDYLQAEEDVDNAKAIANSAQERLATALENVEASRKVLAGIAMEQYRNGGSMQALEAVLSADGITEVIERTSSLEIVNGIADTAVQQFKADSLVADTMQIRAETALADAEDAAIAADEALAAANDLQTDAEEAVDQGQERRTGLISTLATARNTTVELETERQDNLEALRRERAEAQAQADRENDLIEADAPQATTGPAVPLPTSRPSDAPTRPATPAPEPTRTQTPDATPVPVPTATRPPAPTPSATSRPTTPAPTTPAPTIPAPTTPAPTVPAPIPPPKPKPTPPALGGGGVSVGSAAQGAGAVAWAKTKIGSPYGWGSSGPSSYDCSGLTSMAWSSQGVNITRSSRSQYAHVKKIPYAQMRPGDLIFYGSNPANGQTINHVAIYAGNGQMVEALRPGRPLSLSPMRYAGTMAFAGRP